MLAGLACSSPEVAVRVSIPGADAVEAPVPNLPLVFLPYDRDSIIAALEARAPTPRPNARTLDSLFEKFRAPFEAYADAEGRAGKLRDSLEGIKRHLDSLPRNAPEYKTEYLRFSAGFDSLKALEKVRDQRQQELDKARTRLGPKIDSLRTAMRQWESTTYHGYDSLTAQLAKSRGRAPIADTTGADGRARVRLIGKPWWIYARSWDAQDPNQEWYWNVPVTRDSLVLDRQTGKRRPRY
jgi:hypothetical protein